MSTHRDIQPATDEQIAQMQRALERVMPSDVLALIARIRQLQTELNAVIDLSTEHEMEAAYQREIIAKMRPIVEAAVGYVTSTDSFTTSYRTLDAPLRESVRAYLAESPLDVA